MQIIYHLIPAIQLYFHMVRFYHGKDGHATGTIHTLTSISKHYWVTQAREEIQQVQPECYKCKLGKQRQQIKWSHHFPDSGYHYLWGHFQEM